MKFTFLLVLLIPFFAFAQHCPFDGTMILVVKASKPLKSQEYITIEETTTYPLNICSYGNNALKDTLKAHYSDIFVDNRRWYFEKYLKMGKNDFTKGNYLLAKTYTQIQCVEIKKDEKNYEYPEIHERSFILKRIKKGKVVKEKAISSKNFYKLCTSAGSWDRIIASEF